MEKKIKVLHIIHGFSTGGAESVLINICRYFKNDKDIDLIALSLEKNQHREYEQIIELENLNVIFPEKELKDYFPSFSKKILFFLKKLRRYYTRKFVIKKIKKIKPDIVQVHIGPIMNITYKAIEKSKISHKLYSMHSMPQTMNNAVSNLISKALNHANYYAICVSEEQAFYAKNIYKMKDNYQIIRNGVDVKKYIKISENEISSVKKAYGIPTSFYVIGCVARFHKIKNHYFLINLFNELLKYRDDLILLLIGDGSERLKCEKLVNNLGIFKHVIFTGNQKNIIDFYSIMDLFMLCSKFESCSITTVEAQLMNLPCIISNGIPKSTIISSCVKQLDINDSKNIWIDNILKMLGKKNNILDYDKFDLAYNMQKLKNVYKRLINGK